MNPKLLILFIFMLSTLNVMTDVDAVWFNSSWDFKKEIQINGTGLDIPVNYQLKLEVDYDSDMNSTFKDLRFTNSDENVSLDYWVEQNVSSTNATVWVEVPAISNSSNTTLYMYYGNPTATSESNITNTMIFGDGFDDASLNTIKWVSSSGAVESGGLLTLDSWTSDHAGAEDYVFASNDITPIDSIIEYRINAGTTKRQRFGITDQRTTFFLTSANYVGVQMLQDGNIYTDISNGVTRTQNLDSAYSNGYRRIKLVWTSGNAKFYYDGSLIRTYTSNVPTSGNEMHVLIRDESIMDWVLVRKYTATEPTYSIGAEEESNTAPTVTLNSPADDSTNASKTVSFRFTPIDETGFTSCALWTNETSWSEKESNTSSITNNSINTITETFTTDGTYIWNVKCIDSGSLSAFASSNWTINIDSTAPTYSDNSTNTTLSGVSTLFSLKWQDTNLSGYIFSFDNGTGSFTNDSFVEFSGVLNWSNVTKIVNLTIGATIQWKVYANDTLGHLNVSETYSYNTVGIESLEVALDTPVNDTAIADNTPDFVYIVTGDRATYNCELFINDTGYGTNASTQNNTATTITANTSIGDGESEWNINCTANGITNTSEIRTITIDTTPPQITIYSPENITYYDINSILLRVLFNENVDSVNYSLNGGANQTMSVQTSTEYDCDSAFLLSFNTQNFSLSDSEAGGIYDRTNYMNDSNDGTFETIYNRTTAPPYVETMYFKYNKDIINYSNIILNLKHQSQSGGPGVYEVIFYSYKEGEDVINYLDNITFIESVNGTPTWFSYNLTTLFDTSNNVSDLIKIRVGTTNDSALPQHGLRINEASFNLTSIYIDTLSVINGQNNVTVYATDILGNTNSTTVYFYVVNTSFTVSYTSGNYLDYDITGITGIFAAIGQTSTIPAITINNIGNINISINMSVNVTQESCFEFWVSNDSTLDTVLDYNVTNAVNTTVLTNIQYQVNSTLLLNQTLYDGGTTMTDNDWMYAQNFSFVSNTDVGQVGANVWRTASPTDIADVSISIQTVDGNGLPTGSILGNATITYANIPTSAGTITYATLNDTVSLVGGTEYTIVFSANDTQINNDYKLGYKNTDVYAGGIAVKSSDGGSSWDVWGSDWDLTFGFKDDTTEYDGLDYLWSWMILDDCSVGTTFWYTDYYDSFVS